MRHHHHHLLCTTAMPPSIRRSILNSIQSPLNCDHSASHCADLIILISAITSAIFLILSYFSYIFHSISLIIPIISPALKTIHFSSLISSVAFLLFFLIASISCFHLCFGTRKCGRLGCKGLKKSNEFDVLVQSEECLKLRGKDVVELDLLPWKGGKENNPDYECLRCELRKMAPPNGRAILVFRARCGCPIAKLEGWNVVRRGRKHKKMIALNGGDHR